MVQKRLKKKIEAIALSCRTGSAWCAVLAMVVSTAFATVSANLAPAFANEKTTKAVNSSAPEAKTSSAPKAETSSATKPAAVSKNASKQKKKITAEQAVALVKQRADVKRFLALFPNGKSKSTQGFPVVEAEKLDNNWNVHVYEQTPDHTATMNWFEVDSQTGVIKPMTE